MTKRKNPPYYEIIDIEKEFNEYIKLCDCNSDKFTYYLDWKEHIVDEFDIFDSNDNIENVKHYLLYKMRNSKHFNATFVSLMVFAITIYLNNFVKIFINSDLGQNVSDFICFLIIILICIIMICKNSNKLNQRYYFYCDLIEILEEIQNKKKDG